MLFMLTIGRGRGGVGAAFVWVKGYSLKVLSSFLPTVSSKSLLQGLVSVSKLILQHSLSDAERKEKMKELRCFRPRWGDSG